MLVLALLAVSAVAADVDLPVATQGTEQWAGVVAKAMTAGGRSQAESMQALKSFQSSVMGKMGKTVNLSCSLTPIAMALWIYLCLTCGAACMTASAAPLTWDWRTVRPT